ncbi:MAG: MaoC family dehydratase N-terminal domain-containing protein [Candidatus Bathyarchaeia archaeon]
MEKENLKNRDSEFFERLNQLMESKVGWATFKSHQVSAESIRRFGLAVDPNNPLWHDDSYASSTRWGSIIAFPTFEVTIYSGVLGDIGAPSEWGFQTMIWIGEDWKMYRPIRPGDVIKVWNRRPRFFEFEPDPGENKVLGIIDCDCDYINQNDELISSVKVYVQRTYHKEKVIPPPLTEYGYTREEILFLAELMKKERIRGKEILYWEDVKIGDQLQPVVLGPTTMADNAVAFSFSHSVDAVFTTRPFFLEAVKDEGFGDEIIKGEDGFYYVRGGPPGRHWSNRSAQAEGEPMAFLFGVLSKFTLLRTITNWMGDDGFIKEFKWRHMVRSYVGDALVSKGVVSEKMVEGNEFLVKVKVWLENLRGYVTEAAVATVSLMSRTKGPKVSL